MARIFETERFLVESLSLADRDIFYELGRSMAVMRYIAGKPVTDRAESLKLLTERIVFAESFPGLGSWKVLDKATGDHVGNCNYNFIRQTNLRQIGYALREASWGKGIATELSNALVAYHDARVPEEALFAVTHLGNTASGRVLQKAGFSEIRRGFYYGEMVRVYQRKKNGLIK